MIARYDLHGSFQAVQGRPHQLILRFRAVLGIIAGQKGKIDLARQISIGLLHQFQEIQTVYLISLVEVQISKMNPTDPGGWMLLTFVRLFLIE